MILALLVCGVVVALVVVGLFVFGLRRRLIQRSGGTFDCSLRWAPSEKPDQIGQGLGLRSRPLQRRPRRVVPGLLLRPPPAPSAGAAVHPGRLRGARPRARKSWRCSPTRLCLLLAPRTSASNWR